MPDREEEEARRAILEAALGSLEEFRNRPEPVFPEVYDDLAHHYRQRLAVLNREGDDSEGPSKAALHDHFVKISQELLRIERETAVRLRNDSRISDELLRKIERELDLSETHLAEKARG